MKENKFGRSIEQIVQKMIFVLKKIKIPMNNFWRGLFNVRLLLSFKAKKVLFYS